MSSPFMRSMIINLNVLIYFRIVAVAFDKSDTWVTLMYLALLMPANIILSPWILSKRK